MSLLDYFVEVNPLKEKVFAKSNQEWSVVGFEINMKRKSYKYIINFFFPSCALATISLVSWTQLKLYPIAEFSHQNPIYNNHLSLCPSLCPNFLFSKMCPLYFCAQNVPTFGRPVNFCALNFPTFGCPLYFCAWNALTFFVCFIFCAQNVPTFCVHFIFLLLCHNTIGPAESQPKADISASISKNTFTYLEQLCNSLWHNSWTIEFFGHPKVMYIEHVH